MAKKSVVVERHLGVEREPVSALGDDQRIDFSKGRVLAQIGFDETADNLRETGDLGWFNSERETERARLVIVQPKQRIDIDLDDLLGASGRDLFDVDAPFGARHHQNLALRTVKHNAQVVFLCDLGAGRDQDLVDNVPANIHPNDPLASCACVGRILGDCDSACFATSAGVHLRFHRNHAAKPRRDLSDLVRRRRDFTAIDRHTVPAEDRGRLILVNIHRSPRSLTCFDTECRLVQPVALTRGRLHFAS